MAILVVITGLTQGWLVATRLEQKRENDTRAAGAVYPKEYSFIGFFIRYEFFKYFIFIILLTVFLVIKLFK